MKNTDIKIYLERLEHEAKEILTSDGIYNDKVIKLDCYGYINMAIIRKAVQEKLNLHIRTSSKEGNKNLYIPIVLSIFVSGFILNYIEYKPQPKVGEILQKEKERFTVLKVDNNKITIRNKAQSLIQNISKELYARYIITTADRETDGRKLKKGFDDYRKFFNLIINGGVGEKMPSKFQYKYLIITSKDIYDFIRKIKLENIKVYNSLPIRYISSSGIFNDSIPIDPMVYIVNDYETAENYILRHGDISIETVVVIGDSKYREEYNKIAGDIRAKRVKNVIFVGSESIETFKDLYRWNWTRTEELAYWNLHEVKIKELFDSPISEKILLLQSKLEEIERKYNISLYDEISDDLWYLSRIILPNKESVFSNRLEILKLDFKERLEDKFWDEGLEDETELESEILNLFNCVVDSVNSDKFDSLNSIPRKSNVVVSKDYIDEIKFLLKDKRILSYSEFLKLDKQSNDKVYFLSVYGENQIKEVYSRLDKFEPYFILYPHEKKRYEILYNKYISSIENEFSSEDRLYLLGVKYGNKSAIESVNDKFSRIEKLILEKENEAADRIENGQILNVSCELEFEDGYIKIIDSCSSVLVCSDDKVRIVTVDKLRVGDFVRIYENVNKDKLWNIALENDISGNLKDIESASKYWKESLKDYKERNGLSIQELYRVLCRNGLSRIKNCLTIDRWINDSNSVKFPATVRNMEVIRKTINSSEFNSKYAELKQKRGLYRGFKISLGRDLSNEIALYLKSNGEIIGPNLMKFDDEICRSIAEGNAPIRKINKITYLQNGTREE